MIQFVHSFKISFQEQWLRSSKKVPNFFDIMKIHLRFIQLQFYKALVFAIFLKVFDAFCSNKIMWQILNLISKSSSSKELIDFQIGTFSKTKTIVLFFQYFFIPEKD